MLCVTQPSTPPAFLAQEHVAASRSPRRPPGPFLQSHFPPGQPPARPGACGSSSPDSLAGIYHTDLLHSLLFFFFFWFTSQLSHGARAASRTAAPPAPRGRARLHRGTPPRCAPRRRRAEPLIDVFSTKPPKSLTAPPASAVPGHVPRRGDLGEQDAAGLSAPDVAPRKPRAPAAGWRSPRTQQGGLRALLISTTAFASVWCNRWHSQGLFPCWHPKKSQGCVLILLHSALQNELSPHAVQKCFSFLGALVPHAQEGFI